MRAQPSTRLVLLTCLAVLWLGACSSPEAHKVKYLAKGRAYAAQGNWEKARIEYRNALQAQPNDAVVRYEVGYAAEKLGNIREAMQFFQAAIDLDKDYVDARSHLARLFLFGGATERALETLAPAIDKHPDDSTLLSLRAACRARQKDLPGALADAEHAHRVAPDAEDAIAVLAGTYNAAGRSADSRALLETSVTRLPKSTELREALLQSYLLTKENGKAAGVLKDLMVLQPTEPAHPERLARLYAADGKVDEAVTTLRAAIVKLPTAVTLTRTLVQLLAQKSGFEAAEKELLAEIAAEPKQMPLRFTLAQLYVETKRTPQAEATLQEIIKLAPSGPQQIAAKDALAGLKVGDGDVPAAEKLIAEVLKTNPRDSQALALRAEIAYSKADYRAAIDDWRSVLRDQPDSLPIVRALARAHVSNNESEQAETLLRHGIETHPNDVAIRLDLLQLLLNSGRYEQARTVADDLVKAQPDSPLAREAAFRVAALQKDVAGMQAAAAAMSTSHPELPFGDYFSGMVLEDQGNLGAALAKYSSAVDKNAGYADGLNAYVRLLLREKKPEVVLARLQKITTQYPKYGHAWQLLGETQLLSKHLPEAEQAFHTAIEAMPEQMSGYQGLSLVHLEQHDVDAAIAVLKSASGKVKPPEQAPMALALTYQRLGRTEEAARAYEDVLHINPTSPVALNNLAMILVARRDPASLERAAKLVAPLASSPSASLQDTYAWVSAARGEYGVAVPLLEKLVAANPSNSTFRAHLGVTQVRAGHADTGRATLQAVAATDDHSEGAALAKAALAAMQVGTLPQ